MACGFLGRIRTGVEQFVARMIFVKCPSANPRTECVTTALLSSSLTFRNDGLLLTWVDDDLSHGKMLNVYPLDNWKAAGYVTEVTIRLTLMSAFVTTDDEQTDSSPEYTVLRSGARTNCS
jgi:hypothetical protein